MQNTVCVIVGQQQTPGVIQHEGVHRDIRCTGKNGAYQLSGIGHRETNLLHRN